MDQENQITNSKDWRIGVGVFAGFVILVLILSSGGSDNSKPTSTTKPVITTLYTTGISNVRSCGSLNCKSIGTYPVNTTIDITTGPYAGTTDLSQLPDWVILNFDKTANGYSTGYISKTVLSDHPQTESNQSFQTQQPIQTTQSTQKSLANIVSEWRPRIVRINCADTGNTIWAGTGVLTRMNFPEINKSNAPTLVTNKHVVTNPYTGYLFTYCNFQTPDTDQIGNLDMSSERSAIGQDVAYFPSSSTNPPPGAATPMKVCQVNDIDLGDDIVVLGYPGNGGTGNASTAITVTPGIISSYDGEYYVTSAKIDHGNSGGAAILVKNDCYFGIPTWAESGGFESFGRILSTKYIFN